MCQMKGYSAKEFINILCRNGWKYSRRASSHVTYCKSGEKMIITVPDKGSDKELSRPLIQRIIKEAKLVL